MPEQAVPEAAVPEPDAPVLAGVHHLKLPVSDLARSAAWYRSRLGYEIQVEFVEHDVLMGYAMTHPRGGPMLALRLDPARARAAAGFDYFSIGVPDKEAIERLAARLTSLDERHAGVHFASIGWILPELHDPDGHEVRFYTLEHHADPVPSEVTTIRDPRETSRERERAKPDADNRQAPTGKPVTEPDREAGRGTDRKAWVELLASHSRLTPPRLSGRRAAEAGGGLRRTGDQSKRAIQEPATARRRSEFSR